jgi:hypothetical protein
VSVVLYKATSSPPAASCRGMPIVSHFWPNLTPCRDGWVLALWRFPSNQSALRSNSTTLVCIAITHYPRTTPYSSFIPMESMRSPSNIVAALASFQTTFNFSAAVSILPLRNPSKPAPRSRFSISFTSLHLRAKVPHTTSIVLSRNLQTTPALPSPNYDTEAFSA